MGGRDTAWEERDTAWEVGTQRGRKGHSVGEKGHTAMERMRYVRTDVTPIKLPVSINHESMVEK